MAIKKKNLPGTERPGTALRVGSSSATHSASRQKKISRAAKGDPTQIGVFHIVSIVASAGGLAAYKAFFSGMPIMADPDMAFGLVQHLATDHNGATILVNLVITR